jgi:hypothetical protein
MSTATYQQLVDMITALSDAQRQVLELRPPSPFVVYAPVAVLSEALGAVRRMTGDIRNVMLGGDDEHGDVTFQLREVEGEISQIYLFCERWSRTIPSGIRTSIMEILREIVSFLLECGYSDIYRNVLWYERHGLYTLAVATGDPETPCEKASVAMA